MGILDKIMGIGRGNPGALRVGNDLEKKFGEQSLDKLTELGIHGADVWYLYNDECGGDLDAMHKSLQNGTAVKKLKGNRWSSFYR